MDNARRDASQPDRSSLDCTCIPYRLFVDPEVQEQEQDRLWQGPIWSYVGLEAELAEPGAFRTTTIGRAPVVATRDLKGQLHLLLNRCAHRGAMVCRAPRGRLKTIVCPYHQWNYDLAGRLRGVPFRAGVNGRGGYPADFSLSDHGLTELRLESCQGVLFGSFSPQAPALSDYLGSAVVEELARVFNRPIQILGYSRQEIRSNWKLYAENTRDPYHASLLHLFHATFTSHRATAEGTTTTGPNHGHIQSFKGDDEAEASAFRQEAATTEYKLADPSLMAGRPEFGRRALSVLSIFPNLVVQQISNTLATRQIVPLEVDRFELVVTYFGYQDDDDELRAIRLKQANLIGPAGYISLEDGYAVELVQRALANHPTTHSVIEMGGRDTAPAQTLVTENALRAFWRSWGQAMGLRLEAAAGAGLGASHG
ncbi:MAG TPA: SRPBCC family protein [Candidatus Binataceae bacterium]|nr:SRPBCC family protein [Candidatus Binataceae bacterium]